MLPAPWPAPSSSHSLDASDVDIGNDQPIPLPNVTAKILQKVIDYCRYHVEHPAGADGDKRDDGAFDRDFVKVDQPMLFDLILAANYLDIRPLLDLTCHTVAAMIKGAFCARVCDVSVRLCTCCVRVRAYSC